MPVYLDHAAMTPVRPEAAAAMLPWLTERFGNPSGSHAVARGARSALDDGRDVVAAALGVGPGGVVFTAGGTESDNLALIGVLADRPGAIVTTAAEHGAVLRAAAATGREVRAVGLGPDGVVDPDEVGAALHGEVALVSVMLVNNEVGTIQPVVDVVERVRRRAPGALVHTDAVQAAAWMDVAAATGGVDLISVSAHKFGGPQGVGALGVRDGVAVRPLLHGGGQERERRSGTHNVAGVAGMVAALEASAAGRAAQAEAVGRLRDRLADTLLATVDAASETGARAAKVPGNCHLLIPGVEAEDLLVLLDAAGLCASAGSACASGAIEPSHVLLAMGIAADEAAGSLRLSLGWTSTDADVDAALAAIPAAVDRLRSGPA